MKRQGFTLIELMVVVLIIGLLIAILLPSLGEAMEAGKRMQCAANLRGLANTFKIYQQENNDQMPAVPQGYVNATTNPTGTNVDTMTSLWLMVVAGKSSPDVFICPSDLATNKVAAFKGDLKSLAVSGVKTQDLAFPIVKADGTYESGLTTGKRSCSYSYQVPNGSKGSPGTANSNSTRFAIMSDRAPFNSGDDALDYVPTGSVQEATAAGDARSYLRDNFATISKKINSPNHAGKGQNVLFQDGHCKWQPDPWCGIGDDNIFTRAKDDSAVGRVVGANAEVPTKGPYTDDDSVLVDIKAGSWSTDPSVASGP